DRLLSEEAERLLQRRPARRVRLGAGSRRLRAGRQVGTFASVLIERVVHVLPASGRLLVGPKPRLERAGARLVRREVANVGAPLSRETQAVRRFEGRRTT